MTSEGPSRPTTVVAGISSPRIQVSHPTNLKMPPRSPSRESVATEMSLSSSYLSECVWNGGPAANSKLAAHLGFLKSVPENQQLSAYLTPQRGPSPVPGSCGGGGAGRFLRVPGAGAAIGARSTDGSACWEDETDLGVIKSCAALSKALGIQKSFSTGDIVSLDDSNQNGGAAALRACVSEVALGAIQQQYERMNPPFGMGSRSMSTWVAVGDTAAIQISSQLASPQGRPTSVHVDGGKADAVAFAGVSFTPADLILNLNKRVRQCYIRRRLLTTYKALERLSQSQFNLDQIAAVAEAAQQPDTTTDLSLPGVITAAPAADDSPTSAKATHDPSWAKGALTLNDVERDQGRPLSKYMRNMMIFNWLHSLEDDQAEML